MPEGSGLVCARSHRFDRSRHGFYNLLQPQDRRSRNPGDAGHAVLARRRLFDAGVLEPLYAPLRERLRGAGAILDVGCGEGHLAGPLAGECDVVGIDLAAKAIELAARRWSDGCWVVANADRQLPVASASFDVITSIASRRSPVQFARALRPGGRAMIAVPGAEDLVELRELIGGTAVRESRIDAVAAEFAPPWHVESSWKIEVPVACTAAIARDLLAASYRGQRASAASVLQRVTEMTVTLAFDVVELRIDAGSIDAKG